MKIYKIIFLTFLLGFMTTPKQTHAMSLGPWGSPVTAVLKTLYSPDGTENEFLDECSKGTIQNYITPYDTDFKADGHYTCSIKYLLKYNNCEGMITALAHNHAHTINALIYHIVKTKKLHNQILRTLESEQLWAILKNDWKKHEHYGTLLKRFDLYKEYREMALLPESYNDLVDRLTCACLVNGFNTAKYLVQQLQKLNKNFDINSITYENESLLHHAARHNNPDIITLLLKLDHKVYIKNGAKLTPLNVAMAKENKAAHDVLTLFIITKLLQDVAPDKNQNIRLGKDLSEKIVSFIDEKDLK